MQVIMIIPNWFLCYHNYFFPLVFLTLIEKRNCLLAMIMTVCNQSKNTVTFGLLKCSLLTNFEFSWIFKYTAKLAYYEL